MEKICREHRRRGPLWIGSSLLTALLAPAVAPTATMAQSQSTLYNFVAGPTNGDHPYSGLIADKAGNFYGTTENGGVYNSGTVFELSPPATKGGAWTETPLYVFTGGSDGGVPKASLIFDKSGNLYGTTSQGGSDYNDEGVVFKLVPPAAAGGSWSESVLYSFSGAADGGVPLGSVVFDRSGNLLGSASQGGDLACGYPTGCGVVYRLSPPAGGISLPWNETALWSFEGQNASTPDGQTPSGPLTFDRTRKYVYGTTQAGGANGFGMAFKLRLKTRATAKIAEQDIYDFAGNPDGQTPDSGVIADKKGNLYGTTSGGGANGFGSVFELSAAGAGSQWNETDLFDFAGTDGGEPIGNVAFHGKDLIGTTAGTGTASTSGSTLGKYGTVFELVPGASSWTETVLYDFAGGATGSTPTGKLVIRKGAIYGTALYGGNGNGLGWGTLYRVLP